jgi:hypothetical protein
MSAPVEVLYQVLRRPFLQIKNNPGLPAVTFFYDFDLVVGDSFDLSKYFMKVRVKGDRLQCRFKL